MTWSIATRNNSNDLLSLNWMCLDPITIDKIISNSNNYWQNDWNGCLAQFCFDWQPCNDLWNQSTDQIKNNNFHFYFLISKNFHLIRSRSVMIFAIFVSRSNLSILSTFSSSVLILEFNVARTTQSQKMNETIEMIVCGCNIRVWMSIFLLIIYINLLYYNQNLFFFKIVFC